MEGQIIPPAGMSLSDEVWIVTDFTSLAGGIADDLAAERAPLMQEIQERRDHVQRAQSDIASREERIRLIQEEIQATKDQVGGLVKQARDATQKIWDTEGAEIDREYQDHFASLKASIADRARSLKLAYTPDPAYDSPEVWANAYRLALYQVPAGVDGTKEHQWIGDQMKAWRDFQKSLDDRREQLREKTAQIKLEPGSKLADLSAKIDDLNQRIEATQTEEVPLKTELQAAQNDLAQAPGGRRRPRREILQAALLAAGRERHHPHFAHAQRALHLGGERAFRRGRARAQLLDLCPRHPRRRPPVLGAAPFQHPQGPHGADDPRARRLHLHQGAPAAGPLAGRS